MAKPSTPMAKLNDYAVLLRLGWQLDRAIGGGTLLLRQNPLLAVLSGKLGPGGEALAGKIALLRSDVPGSSCIWTALGVVFKRRRE